MYINDNTRNASSTKVNVAYVYPCTTAFGQCMLGVKIMYAQKIIIHKQVDILISKNEVCKYYTLNIVYINFINYHG